MTLVAVLGDGATTTSVALAAAWPADDDVVVVEADPRGGCLAAWLGLPATPSLSTAVTVAPDGDWERVEPLLRAARGGLRVLPAPVRAVEAGRAVDEASVSLLPVLAARPAPIAVVDVGRVAPAEQLPVAVGHAHVLVVVHRQLGGAAAAEAVRVERSAEVVTCVAAARGRVVLAVIGERPFDPAEIVDVAAEGVDVTWLQLPHDPLAASVLAGRGGVGSRRLGRLPLVRRARLLAAMVRERMPAAVPPGAVPTGIAPTGEVGP